VSKQASAGGEAAADVLRGVVRAHGGVGLELEDGVGDALLHAADDAVKHSLRARQPCVPPACHRLLAEGTSGTPDPRF
jgi:hypothetical protein